MVEEIEFVPDLTDQPQMIHIVLIILVSCLGIVTNIGSAFYIFHGLKKLNSLIKVLLYLTAFPALTANLVTLIAMIFIYLSIQNSLVCLMISIPIGTMMPGLFLVSMLISAIRFHTSRKAEKTRIADFSHLLKVSILVLSFHYLYNLTLLSLTAVYPEFSSGLYLILSKTPNKHLPNLYFCFL